MALGLTKTPFKNQIIAWGRFQGFIQATGTRGVKTPGVDDEGFFNCCMKLNIPGVFEELQDIWESLWVPWTLHPNLYNYETLHPNLYNYETLHSNSYTLHLHIPGVFEEL